LVNYSSAVCLENPPFQKYGDDAKSMHAVRRRNPARRNRGVRMFVV
jgi:hypothetical protein